MLGAFLAPDAQRCKTARRQAPGYEAGAAAVSRGGCVSFTSAQLASGEQAVAAAGLRGGGEGRAPLHALASLRAWAGTTRCASPSPLTSSARAGHCNRSETRWDSLILELSVCDVREGLVHLHRPQGPRPARVWR